MQDILIVLIDLTVKEISGPRMITVLLYLSKLRPSKEKLFFVYKSGLHLINPKKFGFLAVVTLCTKKIFDYNLSIRFIFRS